MSTEGEKRTMRGRNGGTLTIGGAGGGRPRKIPDLQTLVNTVMGEEGKDGKTAMEAVWAALRAKAAKGDIRAAELLIKYSYGQPRQEVDLTTKGESLNENKQTLNVVFQPRNDDPAE